MLQTLCHNMEAQSELLLALAPESVFLASPKGAVSARCGQVGACCSFDFLGFVQQQVIILTLGLLNQEHGAFAGYSHLL